MSKTNLSYDADLKEQVSHVEYDGHHHIDLHDAAATGHLATDERGNPLIEIDEVASRRLARKVSFCSQSSSCRITEAKWYFAIDRFIHRPDCRPAVFVRLHRPSKHR